MGELYLSELFIKNFLSGSNYFKISYQEHRGSVLNCLVRQVSPDHFEVLIEEKEVIIHFVKDENGIISCTLNSQRNPIWVNGIREELEKALRWAWVELQEFACNLRAKSRKIVIKVKVHIRAANDSFESSTEKTAFTAYLQHLFASTNLFTTFTPAMGD